MPLDTITALGLLESVYFCDVLSMGQLPFQLVHPNGRASSLRRETRLLLAETLREQDWTHLYA
ncbi:hypothetical protein [Scytonema sp. PCC 10023]|uniref:hypothetical protein n=1 Tax=Scytonema sp. PCC 10023 TaxID=1680591 RepID=UPI0039C6ACDB